MAEVIPKTIDELKAFATENNIPLEKLHVHLDEDYHAPKAFGIYRDRDEFVVYKNKEDGSRAVRYRGTDEAYAVNEIYQKIREMGIAAKADSTPKKPVFSNSSYSTYGFSYYDDNDRSQKYKRYRKSDDSAYQAIVTIVLVIIIGLIAHASKKCQTDVPLRLLSL